MVVLICTQQDDVHAEAVAEQINKMGDQVVLLKRYELENYITYNFKPGISDALIKIDGKKYSICHDVRAMYWRVKPQLLSEIPGEASCPADKLRAQEWKEAIAAIEMFMDQTKPIVNPLSTRTLWNRKAAQLKLANDCGLQVPCTTISNDYREILANIEAEDLIYKTLSFFLSVEGTIYTNKIDRQIIAQAGDNIFLTPGIFQQLIPKAFELRVTVVGDKIFPFKVDSQKDSRTTLDWRYVQEEHFFSQGMLTADTTSKLLDFHQKSGLVYGAYDFIVTPTGKEIFLECNPGGQWLFTGGELGEAVTIALAEYLIC